MNRLKKIIATTLATVVLSSSLYINKLNSAVLKVPSRYSTIESAVFQANDDDTVYVDFRAYPEFVMIKDKRLSLIGVIDDKEANISKDEYAALNGILITNSSRFFVKGFSILDSKESAIYVKNSTGTIEGNYIANSSLGINASLNRNNIVISNNDLEYNKRGILINGGNVQIKRNNISSNGFNSNGYAIDINSDSTLIERNLIWFNAKAISLRTKYFEILNNTLEKNFTAICLADTAKTNGLILNNIISNSYKKGIETIIPRDSFCEIKYNNFVNSPYDSSKLVMMENISASPLFVNRKRNDYRLLPSSRCNSKNSPYGLIGALDYVKPAPSHSIMAADSSKKIN